MAAPPAPGSDIDLDAEHALIEAEDVGEAFTVRAVGLEEEHRLVTASEHGRTDDHAAIAAEPATRDLERDRLFRSAFQVRHDLRRHDTVDPAAAVGPFRTHIDDSRVSDDFGTANDLAELRRHEYRRARDRRDEDRSNKWNDATHLSSLPQTLRGVPRRDGEYGFSGAPARARRSQFRPHRA